MNTTTTVNPTTRMMPNIKPYPYQQKDISYSIYRPAYHRIPTTINNKDLYTNLNQEIMTPIIVPSMSKSQQPFNYQHQYYSGQNMNRQMFHHRNSTPILYSQQQNYNNIPIHQTLENATISFDSGLQNKDYLVKDVFFSPAPSVTITREMSPPLSTTCSSDESISSNSPYETPSDILSFDNQDNLFGLLEMEKKTTKSLVEMNPAFDLPTPPITSAGHLDYFKFKLQQHSMKRRRCSDSILEDRTMKKSKSFITPPESPRMFISNLNTDSDIEEEEPTEFDNEDTFSNWDEQEEDEEEEDNFESEDDNESIKSVQKEHQTIQKEETCNLPKVPARPTTYPTIYQKLTKANIDWCRYCGTTEGVNWRPGPWGKRTLCNKHGCDYKGYGFACKLPRLDLTGFTKESIHDRDRPVLQLFCSGCQRKESWEGNVLVRCEGCPKAYHQKCCPTNELTDDFVASSQSWFCDDSCCENAQRKRIVVELPRKRLPLMRSPTKSNNIHSTLNLA